MLFLLYIVYISLYLCKMHEVHASYPLKYAIRTNYFKKRQKIFSFPTTALCFFEIQYKTFYFYNL